MKLTEEEAIVLDSARRILKKKAKHYGGTYNEGRVAATADSASDALFEYLNTAAHWGSDMIAMQTIDRMANPQVTA